MDSERTFQWSVLFFMPSFYGLIRQVPIGQAFFFGTIRDTMGPSVGMGKTVCLFRLRSDRHE